MTNRYLVAAADQDAAATACPHCHALVRKDEWVLFEEEDGQLQGVMCPDCDEVIEVW